VRARYVGQELALAAQRAGCNGNDMAGALGWSPSKVSRLLSGKRGASTEDVSAFLAVCRVTGPARNELLALTAHGYEPSWWQNHGNRSPVDFPPLAHNEATATSITCFDNTLVPDLLHVRDYTWAALATSPFIPDDEIDKRVARTLRRQQILDRSFGSPTLRVFLTEYALTRLGAGNVVMSDQAHHLLRVAVRPEISIRIVPESTETFGVFGCGPFTLLEFTEHQPTVYLESATSTAFLEQSETITTYRGIIRELDRLALSRDDSRERIADTAQRPEDALAIWATG